MSRITPAGTGSDAAQSASSNGRRETVRKRPKRTAPVISSTTMAEMRSVSVVAWTMLAKDSLRRTRPMTSAPNEPAAPASVGVNQPTYRPPMTSTNSTSASATPESERIFSDHGVAGPGGPRRGLRLHIHCTVPRKSAVSSRPGMMPARNRRSSDCSVCTAMTIITTLGGITTPSVPPTATAPVLSARS